MSTELNLSKPHRTILAGVIVMDSETEVLDVAPIDILHGLGKHFVNPMPEVFIPDALKSQALDIKFHWVAESKKPIRLTSGISLTPTIMVLKTFEDDFATCPPLDIVLIGAHQVGYTPNEAELAFVRKAYEEATAFMTVCAGILVPLQAGILVGKTATGPLFMLDYLKQKSPTTEWLPKRWVRDGKLWTSGALLNGMDMVHAFAIEHWAQGEESLVSVLAEAGAWPNRDVDYKDANVKEPVQISLP